MAMSRRDVVLLNSDTVVTDGWLGALMRCAASDPSIGTITPFSNNAEILSYPRFCVNNAWPDDADPAPLARAFAKAAVPTYPDVPTASASACTCAARCSTRSAASTRRSARGTARRTTCACAPPPRGGATSSPTTRSCCTPAAAR
jgi:hypothetical protein